MKTRYVRIVRSVAALRNNGLTVGRIVVVEQSRRGDRAAGRIWVRGEVGGLVSLWPVEFEWVEKGDGDGGAAVDAAGKAVQK